MPKFTIEYTLPGERGKVHTKNVEGVVARDRAIAGIKEKGGKIKSVSSTSSSERRIIP